MLNNSAHVEDFEELVEVTNPMEPGTPGITDEKVSRFTFANKTLPCLYIKDITVLNLRYKAEAAKRFLSPGRVVEGTVPDSAVKDIAVYYADEDGEEYSLGSISAEQVRGFAGLVGLDNLEGYLKSGKKLSGHYILAMAQ